MAVADIFLESIVNRLADYKNLADKTFAQLNEEDFHFIAAEESNSIAVVIQHLHGNMMSRWTDFLSSDGEKEWRKRDAEFEEQRMNKNQLTALWEEGWKCVFDALRSLSGNDLEKTVHIRSETLSVVDAINRQLAHYSYHVGQIIFVGKMIKKKDWQNLSMPKNPSTSSG